MNPVLLKPGGERAQPGRLLWASRYADADARATRSSSRVLREVVLDALADLRARYDVVVCEGAGSPAEINLRAGDLANMGLARRGRPAGRARRRHRPRRRVRLAVRHPRAARARRPGADRRLRHQQVPRRRHAPRARASSMLAALTGRPTLGVLPWLDGLWLDAEDSLALERRAARRAGRRSGRHARGRRRPAALDEQLHRRRRAHRRARGQVRFTRSPADVERADLVVVPGTKATVEDLERLRAGGLDDALARRAAAGDPILGVCGGYQMLGEAIEDEVESRRGTVAGLGLLPVRTRFARRQAAAPRRRHGRAGRRRAGDRLRDPPRRATAPRRRGDDRRRQRGGRGLRGRSRRSAPRGTACSRATRSAAACSRGWRRAAAGAGWPGAEPFAAVRERHLDRLGELI